MITCLSSDWLKTKDEVAVFEAFAAYIGLGPQGPAKLRELFDCIRVEHLPREFFLSKIVTHTLLKLSDPCRERMEDYLNGKLPKSTAKRHSHYISDNDRLFIAAEKEVKGVYQSQLSLLNEASAKWEFVKELPKNGYYQAAAVGRKLCQLLRRH